MSLVVAEHDISVKPKILVVEDDPSLREALQDTLSLAKYSSIVAPSAEKALDLLAVHQDIGMVISDVNMGEMSGHDLLHTIKEDYAHLPVLLMTAYASIRDSVDAIRHGAIDYLVKPFEPKALVDIVAAQLDGKTSLQGDNEPIASAASSRKLFQLAQRVAQTESTVLINGESGTGKEVLARYIHRHSPRSEQPFIAINCAAIPENMLEAILFGYEKGAYTGAYNSAPGKFEQANGGTLLLDEISEMDLGLQAKLLRVLQENEVERLGGRKPIALDVRVIATSNRNMKQHVSVGKFREDLYYRLSVLPLQWLALRERREDILPLAKKLLEKHSLKQKRAGVNLAESAQRALLDYHWPGNVRELDNVMQRALILQTGMMITDVDLGLEFTSMVSADDNIATQTSLSSPTRENMQQAYGHSTSDTYIDDKTKVLGDDLKQREFEIIIDTLQQERGSRKNTAERLGISPRTLRYKLAKMRELGFDLDESIQFST